MTQKINNNHLRERLKVAEGLRAEWKVKMLRWYDLRDATPANDPRNRLYNNHATTASHHYEQYCMECDRLNAAIKQRKEVAQGTMIYGKK